MNKTPSQVDILINAWLLGVRVNRVTAWHQYRIADLRSRVCNAEYLMGKKAERERVKNKRYLEYYLNPIPKSDGN